MLILLSIISAIAFFYFSFSVVKRFFKKNVAILFLLILIINPFIWFLIIANSSILFFLSCVSLLLFLSLRVRDKNKFYGTFCFLAGLIGILGLFSKGDFTLIKLLPFLGDPGVINAINSARGDQLKVSPNIVAKLLFNKTYYLVFWFSQFIKQYSLSNLFSLTEDVKDKVFSTTPFLLVFAPFFAYGIFKSFAKLKFKKALVLVILMFSGGLASSFSLKMMDYSLLSFSYPFIAIFIALGINWLVKSKKFVYFLVFLVFLNMAITYYKIFLDYSFYGFAQ